MIHTVNLDMTTQCNKRCPNCCAGVGINRVLQHHDFAYFERAAATMRGIHRLNLTGGEPTAHPRFAEFVPRFREMFGCEMLTMSTNGYRVAQYEDLIVEHFDFIDFSDYQDRRAVLERIRQRMLVNVFDGGINGANFVPRIIRPGGKPCTRAAFRSDGCAYADGRFFGCCVGPGIPGAASVEPSPDWNALVYALPLPCGECWFAE